METTKEQREGLRRKWVEALRSGEFKQQTAGDLHNKHGYCCLGVACVVALREFPGCMSVESRPDGYGVVRYDEEVAGLPRAAMRMYGVRHFFGKMEGRPDLALLNDKGASFAELADIIESRPPGLFVEDDQ